MRPSGRYRHDSGIIGNIMYVFGGVNKSQQRYAELYAFEMTTK